MFAHPACPCTNASLRNLAELSSTLSPDVETTIIFVTRGLDPALIATAPNVLAARLIPRISLVFDDGSEVDRFGAKVSGEVFAFNDAGERIYRGGLTSARGHAGDSEGRRQLKRAFGGEARAPFEAHVFGCRLP